MYMYHIWKILPDESMKSLTLARSSSMQKRTLLFWSHPWEHHTAAKPTFHSSGSSDAIFFPGFVIILYFSFLLIYGNFGGLGLGLGVRGWDFQLVWGLLKLSIKTQKNNPGKTLCCPDSDMCKDEPQTKCFVNGISPHHSGSK